MATDKDQYSPFSCRDAIHHLCKKSRKSTKCIENEINIFLDESFISVLKSNFYIVYELIKLCQVPLCVIGRKQNQQRHQYQCLIDVRHLSDLFAPSSSSAAAAAAVKSTIAPLYWIIDMASGVFLKETTKREKIPRLSYHEKKYRGLKASLWDILQVSDPDKQGEQGEPQSAKDLQRVLEKFNLLEQTNVHYCITLFPQYEIPWVIGHFESTIAPLCFFAYTKADLSIGYAFRQPYRLNQHTLPVAECSDVQDETEPDPMTANRRLAVNVKLTGLLLAYTLGMCLLSEITEWSQALSQCVGAIWLT